MMHYFESKGDKIICKLCHHYCHLKENQTGICGVEKNVNGALLNTTYGYPSALNIDPIEKKPLYHFLPGSSSLSLGTVGCNLRCPFCQNYELSQSHENRYDEYFAPEKIVALALENQCASISYTYNEPVVFYPYAKDIGMIAKKAGLKNIFVSSGFESPEVLEDMQSWVDAANIDLKSFDAHYYKHTLKAGLEEVKNTLITLAHSPVWIEVTTLIIEGHNDSDEELKAMAAFLANEVGTEVPWHLSAFHPDYKMQDTPRTSLDTLNRAKKIAEDAGMQYVYIGNVANDNSTYCPACHSLVIQRNGFGVLANHLENGHCPQCHHKISGVFDVPPSHEI